MIDKNSYVADFETSTGNLDGSTNVYLWGMKDIKSGENYYTDISLDSFMKVANDNKIKQIYFHNLSWDGEFLYHWLFNNGYRALDEKFQRPTESMTFTHMKDNRNKTYDIQVNTEGHVVKFSCSYLMLMQSVSDLGKSLGYPKGEIDYTEYKSFNSYSEVPDILREYLERDIDIVREALLRFKGTYKRTGLTVGATALKDFKKQYGVMQYAKDFGGSFYHPRTKKKQYYQILTKSQWDFLKKGYRGGLCIYREDLKGTLLEHINGHSVDYTSLYPSIMKDKRLPVGQPFEYEIMPNMLKFHLIYVQKAIIKDKNTPNFIPDNHKLKKDVDTEDLTGLATDPDAKYVSHVENEYYHIWDWELKAWEQGYDMDYRIVKTLYFEGKIIYKDWVNDKSHLKLNAADKTEESIHKRILNSLYGKKGQNYRKHYKYFKYDPDFMIKGKRYGKLEHWVECVEVEEKEELSPIHVASAITAWARTKLITDVLANVPNVIYCDTDSMYLMNKPRDIEIHPNKFGAFKYELRFNRFKVIKPKAYLAEVSWEYNKKTAKWDRHSHIKRAIAGLSKENHEKVNFYNFNRGHTIQWGKRQRQFTRGGVILKDTNYTL